MEKNPSSSSSTSTSGCDTNPQKKQRPVIPHNNRLYQRELLVKQQQQQQQQQQQPNTSNNKRGNKRGRQPNTNQDGFEYAVQKDGSLMAEARWQSNLLSAATCNGEHAAYTRPHSNSNSNHNMTWSLQKLQQELSQSIIRYQQTQRLPCAPVLQLPVVKQQPAPPNIKATTSTTTSMQVYEPQASSAVMQNGPPPPPASLNPSVFSSNTTNKNPYQARSAMTTSRTAVLAGSSNLSYAANPNNHSTTITISNSGSGNSKNNTSNKFAIGGGGGDEFDDDLDDLLANMDDDMLLSQIPSTTTTNTMHKSSTTNYHQPRRVTNDYNSNAQQNVIDVDAPFATSSSSAFANSGGGSSYNDNGSSNNNSNTYNSHNSNSNNSNSNTYSNNNDPFASAQDDDKNAPLCPDHSLPCRVLTSHSAANPGRQFYKCSVPAADQQCQFFQWVDDETNNGGSGSGGGFASGGGGLTETTSSNYTSNYNNANNGNGNSYGNGNGNSYASSNAFGSNGNTSNNITNDSFRYGGGSRDNYDDNNQSASGNGAPLCPEHNLPCNILTSNSAANPGRQFYKCSLPNRDEQCDFFEWADGNDTSNNNNFSNNNSSFGNPAASSSALSTWKQTTLPGATEFRPLAGCKDIHFENRKIFGHKTFRPGQQEIIEQAVSGRDVFVLMPTGGGKSLCYQLPAWCCPGLSVVISPLLSLIQDQVQSMTKLGVEAVFLNSSQDYEKQQEINRRLFATTADQGVSLLYVTPEKLRHSGSIQQLLTRLYQNNLLSRFVVDEAHCLSDWGHDFRPDYAALHLLRETFPNVPLMALTATANQKVVDDAIAALRMKRDCYLYRSSFNRPNLHYEVRKKDSKAEESICDYIVQQHKESHHCSGVIYCLSRKDCEKLSEKLQDKLNKRGRYSIKISYYHAELSPEDREYRHLKWSNGDISVLCATIAFGMGIDKPDVRFVIHYSMPKSITHYYQESGRAGRDGEKADCILFYSYKDKQVLEGMIKKSNPFAQSTRRKVDQLYTCLRYCEDDFRCRRTMQLEFFGESFHRNKCRGTCDNCRAGREIDQRDLTEVARVMLTLLSAIQAQKRRSGLGVTLLQLTELFRGSKTKAITKSLPNYARLEGYGHASRYNLKKKPDIDRIAHVMIFERILTEVSEQNKQGFSSDYVQPGENAAAVCNGQKQFFVEFPKEQTQDKENGKATVASKKRKKSPTRKTTKTKNATATKKGSKVIAIFDDDSDDGGDSEQGLSTTSDVAAQNAVLPPNYVLQLEKRIKRVVGMWAEEERMMGTTVYYWHIMSNKVIKTVASQCPTTLEELQALDGLGEQKFKEYGERLIKNIINFVQTEELEEHLAKKKSAQPAKKHKTSVAGSAAGGGAQAAKAPSQNVPRIEDDEFPMDFEVSDLVLPGEQPSSGAQTKSKYF